MYKCLLSVLLFNLFRTFLRKMPVLPPPVSPVLPGSEALDEFLATQIDAGNTLTFTYPSGNIPTANLALGDAKFDDRALIAPDAACALSAFSLLTFETIAGIP